ncbi:bifunctional 3-(3-hydroxy-phenyl)propionate/3-hydroxycinnamic acid hydroxylase [Actibacterium sp. D379-3]
MDYDVAVIGFGPVGACFTGLIANHGLRVVVIEKEEQVFPLPRAAHTDHTGLRAVQEVGCLDDVLVDMVRNKRLDLLNADLDVLVRVPADQPSVSGLPTSIYFYQPDFDTALRNTAGAHPNVDVKLGVEMTALTDQGDGVVLTARAKDGTQETIRAKWVVGCDGAWSPVREAVGIKLHSLNFDEQWLVVDLVLEKAQPQLRMDHALEICDPARPYLSTPISATRHRFELMLLPGEDRDNIDKDKVVGERLRTWFPDGGYRIERSAVYTFHGVVAEAWRKGRVLIAGDAAHQTPPFLGQGMVAGFRDASNLAWKLADVVQGKAPESLLDTYESERSPHATKVIEAAIRIGKVICELDPEKAAKRDALLLANDPTTHKSLVFTIPPLDTGPLVLDGGGRLFIQPQVDGKMFDDIVGSRFLVLARTPAALGSTAGWWRDVMDARVALVSEFDTPDFDRWFDRKGADVVVVRPDRYVLGAGDNLDKITEAAMDKISAPAPAAAS